MKKIILTLSLLVCVIIASIAQTPQFFNYQATFRDNNNQLLVSQDISVRISILQYSTNGTAVYTETHATSTSAQGIVNLKIGSGNTTDDFSEIDWSNGPYFLKLEVDAENSGSYNELGISQLLSVPYALYTEKANETNTAEKAGYADTAGYLKNDDWINSGADISYMEGKVGIGRNSFNSYYNTKLWLHNGWFQVSDSTNHDAGILVKHLNKSGYGYARTVHQIFEGVNGDPYTEFRIRNSDDELTTTSWSVGADNDDEDKFKISFKTDVSTGSSPSYGDNAFTITTNGDIGIGTVSPNAKLEVATGDIYIKDINTGIIMTSPDGQCWRGTMNNSGVLEFVSIACP